MPFTEKIAPGPYREQFTLNKWADEDNPEIDAPYETLTFTVWYDEYNNEIVDPERIRELEERLISRG